MDETLEPLVAPVSLSATVAALREGRIDLPQHVEASLDRIERLEPVVRALLPDPHRRDRERVIAESRALADRWRDPTSRPSLFGALIAAKDIIAVDGLPMRAGSALPLEAFEYPQASAVTRLIEAGAILVGKAVTTEFAYFDPGATANPHHPGHTPGGSSSGSAAAVAAGYVSLALGTQTVGSVIRPAAFCGVVGFKPTFGRVPLDGVLPYSPSVDHLGWFTPEAAGAQLAARVLIADWSDDRMVDPADAAAAPVLAVPVGPYLDQAEPAARASFEQTVDHLRGRGFEVREVAMFEDIEALTTRHRALTTAEFHDQHAARFARYGALYRGISAELYDAGGRISDADRRAGSEGRAELRSRLHETMDREAIDLWLSPATTGPAPAGLRSTGDPAMNLPWTHAGVPAITLPAGSVDGLPLGLQVAARAGADEPLLAHAERIEEALRAT